MASTIDSQTVLPEHDNLSGARLVKRRMVRFQNSRADDAGAVSAELALIANQQTVKSGQFIESINRHVVGRVIEPVMVR